MIILGIDPGIATMGYGVVEKDERGNFRALDFGAVVTPKEQPLPTRLKMLEKGVETLLQKYKPDEVSMEELFFSKNVTTGITVAHARGVIMLACAKHTDKIFEYTPQQIKQALTGYASAEKRQMQDAAALLLKLPKPPKPDDAADALAIALCHAFTSRFGAMFAVGNNTRTQGNNAVSGNRFLELMRAEEAKSRKQKSAVSASAQEALAQATGIAGITGIGRASTLTCPPKNGKKR